MSSGGGKSKKSSIEKGGGANRKRLTHAQSIKRQQTIVHSYDVEHLSFAQIARELTMGEKEVRQAYGRYVRDIAPLMSAASPDEKAAEYLRTLEDVRQQLKRIGSDADNDSAQVGALRELVKVMFKEIELRQHLGLLPRNLQDMRTLAEQRWAGQQIAELLGELNAPPEALEKLEAILSGETES